MGASGLDLHRGSGRLAGRELPVKRSVTAIVVSVGIGLVVILASGWRADDKYQVAAVFDTAGGMVPGQQVKIAGAVVGKVRSVHLDPGPKARIVMDIKRKFAPFRPDARCTILPEGLISEKFVECAPGVASSSLERATGGLPTVALQNTTVPFSLQDVLNVFSLPTDQRIGLLISELGISTAGRGHDINELLARANPTLLQAQDVLKIVKAQRRKLSAAVSQTDQILQSLGSRGEDVRRFVSRAAAVTTTTGEHRDALSEAIHRLPAMLAAVRPGLRSLDRVAKNVSPLLTQLKASGPGLERLTRTLPAFARAGAPAVRQLSSAAVTARRTMRDALPVAKRLNTVAGPLRTVATELSKLLVSTRDRGALDGVLWIAYVLANHSSLYDGVSHIVTAFVNVAPACIAASAASVDLPGCSHKYSAPHGGSLPVNEPSCGPKSSAWYADRCPPAPPGPIGLPTPTKGTTKTVNDLQAIVNKTLGGKPLKSESLKPLLDFLLK
jgi:virulence factor Mce-like protein